MRLVALVPSAVATLLFLVLAVSGGIAYLGNSPMGWFISFALAIILAASLLQWRSLWKVEGALGFLSRPFLALVVAASVLVLGASLSPFVRGEEANAGLLASKMILAGLILFFAIYGPATLLR